jgi:hypothetical protein
MGGVIPTQLQILAGDTRHGLRRRRRASRLRNQSQRCPKIGALPQELNPNLSGHDLR